MKLRHGTYTLVNNIEMSLNQYDGHGLPQEIERNHRIISYEKKKGKLTGFKLDQNGCYRKDVHINELENAYKVSCKAEYKNICFTVHLSKSLDDSRITLKSENVEVLKVLGFSQYTVGDEKKMCELELYSKKYFKVLEGYIFQVKKSDISKIWEERSESDYDLPVPAGIEKIKVIYQNENH